MTRQSKIQSLRDIWSALYWTIQRPDRRTRWEDVGGQINALTTEATIATFLAGVQGTILSLSVNSPVTSTGLTAAKTLSFMGILLDVISAFLALLSSTLLQSKISEVQRLLDGIDHMSLEDLNNLQDEIINSDPRDPFRKFFVDTPLWESLKFEVLKRIMSRLDVLKRQNLESGGLGVAAGAGIISSTVPTHPSSSAPDSRTRQTSRSAQNTTRSHSASRDISSIIDHDLRQVRTQMEQIDSRVEGLLSHLRSLI
ncbi:hypothetical protein K435DRAFT_846229, partial [Dendrothele bispora CBS 962.96]